MRVMLFSIALFDVVRATASQQVREGNFTGTARGIVPGNGNFYGTGYRQLAPGEQGMYLHHFAHNESMWMDVVDGGSGPSSSTSRGEAVAFTGTHVYTGGSVIPFGESAEGVIVKWLPDGTFVQGGQLFALNTFRALAPTPSNGVLWGGDRGGQEQNTLGIFGVLDASLTNVWVRRVNPPAPGDDDQDAIHGVAVSSDGLSGFVVGDTQGNRTDCLVFRANLADGASLCEAIIGGSAEDSCRAVAALTAGQWVVVGSEGTDAAITVVRDDCSVVYRELRGTGGHSEELTSVEVAADGTISATGKRSNGTHTTQFGLRRSPGGAYTGFELDGSGEGGHALKAAGEMVVVGERSLTPHFASLDAAGLIPGCVRILSLASNVSSFITSTFAGTLDSFTLNVVPFAPATVARVFGDQAVCIAAAGTTGVVVSTGVGAGTTAFPTIGLGGGTTATTLFWTTVAIVTTGLGLGGESGEESASGSAGTSSPLPLILAVVGVTLCVTFLGVVGVVVRRRQQQGGAPGASTSSTVSSAVEPHYNTLNTVEDPETPGGHYNAVGTVETPVNYVGLGEFRDGAADDSD